MFLRRKPRSPSPNRWGVRLFAGKDWSASIQPPHRVPAAYRLSKSRIARQVSLSKAWSAPAATAIWFRSNSFAQTVEKRTDERRIAHGAQRPFTAQSLAQTEQSRQAVEVISLTTRRNRSHHQVRLKSLEGPAIGDTGRQKDRVFFAEFPHFHGPMPDQGAPNNR